MDQVEAGYALICDLAGVRHDNHNLIARKLVEENASGCGRPVPVAGGVGLAFDGLFRWRAV